LAQGGLNFGSNRLVFPQVFFAFTVTRTIIIPISHLKRVRIMRLYLPRLLSVFLACVTSAFADVPEGYPFVAFDEGLRVAKSEHKPVFLYFGRYGCTYCDITNKRAFVDPEVRRRYIANYVLVYVDTESGRRLQLTNGEWITEAELGARLKVFVTPLFAFLDADGKPLVSTSGVKKIADLLAMDRFVSGGHFREKTLSQFLRDQAQ
jgi:thioredoxin-related protein